jgi:hypothetical protein
MLSAALRVLRRSAAARPFYAAEAAAASVDPFSLVSAELDAVSERMRTSVVSEARPVVLATAPSLLALPPLHAGSLRLSHRFPR